MIDTTTLVLGKGLLTAAVLLGLCGWQILSVRRALAARRRARESPPPDRT
ncbi:MULTISPECIES: hypothetical protein [Ectothiorhodospira]|nr:MULTISPECIES: hypothetical protein [Ectothiorhodospira]EHQ52702.1 hypothetical protein ECTPHS_08428 [Ectothiorhodospira sp. PHS-1]MCG5512659.1 hypothetical protein [Ectothiorhodospira shaposhnikovii]